MKARKLTFLQPTSLVTEKSPIYQLPSIPPPKDFVVSIDKDGNPLSRYSDSHWNYSTLGFSGFNFKKKNLSTDNLELIKQALIVSIYHPNIFPGHIRSCQSYFNVLTAIASVCDKHKIQLTELPRFPSIHKEVAKSLTPARFKTHIAYLHKLRINADMIGFEFIDQKTIKTLISQDPDHATRQTPYIPPRIWNYQVNRLNEVMDDYLGIRYEFEKCYKWCIKAYLHNAEAMNERKHYINPFNKTEEMTSSDRIIYSDGLDHFLDSHGVKQTIFKWVKYENSRISVLSTYLNLIRNSALLFIANFSIQRKGEVLDLRSDCWQPEHDERLGLVGILVAETTKTDPDCDARWVVPTIVKKAVEILANIARLRRGITDKEVCLPLAQPATEPWSPVSSDDINKPITDLGHIEVSQIWDKKEITITEEDWKAALAITPDLGEREGFGIGMAWRFGNHQLRRTTIVNMFASGVSLSTLQWSAKHSNPHATLYYGRNYTHLRLRSSVEKAVIIESYNSTYRKFACAAEDSIRFLRPHSKETPADNLINLINEGEEKKLQKMISSGLAGCRKNLLGYCMKSSSCEYGGIESVANCVGVPSGGMCADLIIDRKNKASLAALKESHKKEMKTLAPNSRRYNAIKQEAYGIGVALNVIDNQEES